LATFGGVDPHRPLRVGYGGIPQCLSYGHIRNRSTKTEDLNPSGLKDGMTLPNRRDGRCGLGMLVAGLFAPHRPLRDLVMKPPR